MLTMFLLVAAQSKTRKGNLDLGKRYYQESIRNCGRWGQRAILTRS